MKCKIVKKKKSPTTKRLSYHMGKYEERKFLRIISKQDESDDALNSFIYYFEKYEV